MLLSADKRSVVGFFGIPGDTTPQHEAFQPAGDIIPLFLDLAKIVSLVVLSQETSRLLCVGYR